MKKMERKFTVLLSQEDDEKLIAVCDVTQESKGAVLRRLIRSSYSMQVLHQPVCANGMRCYVPHMHQAQTFIPDAPPPPPTTRLPAV